MMVPLQDFRTCLATQLVDFRKGMGGLAAHVATLAHRYRQIIGTSGHRACKWRCRAAYALVVLR